jgi:IS4 transposase
VKVKLKTGETEILATNLNKNEFTKEELKELYAKRWTIETGYDKLKNFIALEEFSGIRKEIIEQDFYAGIFMYNLATTVKFDIEKSNNREPKNKDKKYVITANFSSIITLMYDYIFQLIY